MRTFFAPPLMFWYGFVFSFLLCTGIGAVVQCWFLIEFCGIKGKKRYYCTYILICYLSYLVGLSISFPVSPVVDTMIGTTVLFVFISKGLKQSYILSAIVAALTMAIITLVESLLTWQYHLVLGLTFVPPIIAGIIFDALAPAIGYIIFKFFVHRYSIKSRYKAKYLLAFSLPMFFIAIVLRTVNHINNNLIIKSENMLAYEVLFLTVIAFLCICAVLFAYEKTIKQIENENANIILQTEISAQKNYIAETKEKFEATKAFRHDFKNHMLALRGLVDKKEMEKASAYMDRFAAIDKELSFLVATGNTVVDILLSEKLSYAQKMGIDVQCDVLIPKTERLDDFDLCAIFANAIDNAIKACSSLEDKDKSINIVAKQNNRFLIIDMRNRYKAGGVPQGSGVGLSTIQIVADKYHGAVEISDNNGIFQISIILPF